MLLPSCLLLSSSCHSSFHHYSIISIIIWIFCWYWKVFVVFWSRIDPLSSTTPLQRRQIQSEIWNRSTSDSMILIPGRYTILLHVFNHSYFTSPFLFNLYYSFHLQYTYLQLKVNAHFPMLQLLFPCHSIVYWLPIHWHVYLGWF